MGNKQEPEARKSGDAASSRKVVGKPAAGTIDQRKRSAPMEGQGEAGKSSHSGAEASARKRRKPFVL